MKRNICIIMIIFFCLMTFVPIPVYAETYHIGGTDMSIQLDDSWWYVFTRENIENNSELEELGFSYDFMHDILHNNEMYIYAIMFYDNGECRELLVKKRTSDDNIGSLSDYSTEYVLGFAEYLAQRVNANDYSVYENQYKFTRLKYKDMGYYVCEFYTTVYKEHYTITFQSKSQFNDTDYEEITSIIDSIRFNIDPSLEEPNATSFWDNIITKAIGGAIIGGVASMIVAIANKKRKNRNKNNCQSCNDIE